MAIVILNFNGWYTKDDINLVPQTQGIYIAHAIKWTDKTKNRGTLVRLVYIGKAEGTNNLRKRIQEHINGTDLKQNHCNWAHILSTDGCKFDDFIYSVADKDVNNLGDIETALIYANEDNGILNDKDTHGHQNKNAMALDVKCRDDKGLLKDHKPEQ